MTDTFSSDQEHNGTTNHTNESNGDNLNSMSDDLGSKLQQQIETMQKRIGDKDSHISNIEKENQTLREKLADIDEKLQKMGTVEEALERMKGNKESSQDTALDEDTLKSKLRDIIPNVLKETSEKEKAAANFSQVSETLTKLYGKDKVDEVVSNIAKENGISFKDMIDLAHKSPKAVYRMAGVDTSKQSYAPSHGTNTGFNNKYETRDEQLAYYSKLRRDDPKTYYSPAVQKKFREVCLSK